MRGFVVVLLGIALAECAQQKENRSGRCRIVQKSPGAFTPPQRSPAPSQKRMVRGEQ